MNSAGFSWCFKFVMISVISVPLSAVTVNPALCPTNKIAPHRHVKRWDWGYQPRTLGAFYDLLTPGPGGSPGYDHNLQEVPQKDDPDDCGDIEDYDEHDLSSLSPINPYRDQYGYNDRRFFFGLFNGNRPQPQPPQQYPQQPQYPQNRPEAPSPPQRPQPQRPVKPPYNSGGFFQSNQYRPPILHDPSDNIKPVHDGNYEPQTTYRPNVVGGPISHVVGVPSASVRPQPPPRPTYRPDQFTRRPLDYTTRRPMDYTTRRPLEYTTQSPSYNSFTQYTTQRQRPRQFQGGDSILGSFLDLLFR